VREGEPGFGFAVTVPVHGDPAPGRRIKGAVAVRGDQGGWQAGGGRAGSGRADDGAAGGGPVPVLVITGGSVGAGKSTIAAEPRGTGLRAIS